MTRFFKAQSRFFCGLVVVFVTLLILVWVLWEEPIHDVRLWFLEQAFYGTNLPHPADSVLVERKKYLGGPSLHGDNVCIVAVGEVRASTKTKEEIKKAYRDIRIFGGRVPVKILFADEMEENRVLPYVLWQDEIGELSDTSMTPYVLYVSTKQRVLLFDLRCDD